MWLLLDPSDRHEDHTTTIISQWTTCKIVPRARAYQPYAEAMKNGMHACVLFNTSIVCYNSATWMQKSWESCGINCVLAIFYIPYSTIHTHHWLITQKSIIWSLYWLYDDNTGLDENNDHEDEEAQSIPAERNSYVRWMVYIPDKIWYTTMISQMGNISHG